MTVRSPPSIWWWAFGYFACYVPYSAATKALSSGYFHTGATPVGSLELLPPSVMATVAVLLGFLAVTGWWRKAGRRTIAGIAVPAPGRLTLLSGLCSAGIIATTTLAYTFTGVSIVFVALLMRGGVLVLAPLVDRVAGRRVRWFSWVALGLSLVSLLAAWISSGDSRLPLLCALDVALYLGCYFTRLLLMSRQAKSADHATNLRYFVEEAMVSAPALLVAIAVAALVVGGDAGAQLRAGFTTFFDRPGWWIALVIGALSQGTGIFGGLIFLDQRENAFCVPVNRVSSVLAVLCASTLLAWRYGARWPNAAEWYGAGFIVAAIGFLTIPTALAKRARSAAR
ncbi:MAG: hypothetical protein R3B06_08765 [Kofleriaceae bacterium]